MENVYKVTHITIHPRTFTWRSYQAKTGMFYIHSKCSSHSRSPLDLFRRSCNSSKEMVYSISTFCPPAVAGFSTHKKPHSLSYLRWILRESKEIAETIGHLIITEGENIKLPQICSLLFAVCFLTLELSHLQFFYYFVNCVCNRHRNKNYTNSLKSHPQCKVLSISSIFKCVQKTKTRTRVFAKQNQKQTKKSIFTSPCNKHSTKLKMHHKLFDLHGA